MWLDAWKSLRTQIHCKLLAVRYKTQARKKSEAFAIRTNCVVAASALGQILGRRQNRLIRAIAVLHQECDLEALARVSRVHLQMTVQEPNTWIVCPEPDGGPAAGGHADGVPLGRVDEVVLGGVLGRVEVAEAPPDDEEVVTVEVERVRLHGQQVVRDLAQPRAQRRGEPRRERHARVVEPRRRARGRGSRRRRRLSARRSAPAAAPPRASRT